MDNQVVKIGLMGLGTVGGGVVRILEAHQEDLYKQTGCRIEIVKVLVQNLEKQRSVTVDRSIITNNPWEVLDDPEIDVIVEVMGGIEPTREYILEALERGKHVVTANKDLMALQGGEILSKAEQMGCDVFYEASVAGGIPILRALVEGFSSDRITKMMGIVNGTTNYILTKMSQEGASYEDVLKEAQELGYAESDPTADVEGHDAARKMAILSTLGFHVALNLDEVDVKGISKVTKEDILLGKKLGYEVKLLGIAQRDDDKIEVSVQPTMIPKSHPLASVNGVFNAVYVYGEAVGETMFYGPGAGQLPTATAVVSDLVTVVKNMKLGVNGRGTVAPYKEKKLKSDDQVVSKYFLRFIVADKRGVLAQITSILAENDISLEQVLQQPYQINGESKAEIILVTHFASKANMNKVIEVFSHLDVVKEIKSCYRVEGGEA
ncbi:homoserine dehydrogenase [Microaerobacter geothermalis]|uniref:homoserine dehydrogenase n=1 Tax=Microaerobacter geothermalis TaxID=674972 RepID=UPI001F1CDA4C|nr:homoserine dehydrogenase [Microaerobacter geothermalis]MCF6092722.1 homoserine dehydrogenase [Microaerobacter geothermalis]